MITASIAVVVGLLVGRATGGRTARIPEHSVRSWGLLAAAAGIQVAVNLGVLDGIAVVSYLASYCLLGGFAVRNLHLVGMGLVLGGIMLNTTVVALNGGMPVRPSAARAAGVEAVGPAHHFEDGGETLMVLADVIPAGLTNEVLSFGDLVFSVGLAAVAFHALRPRPRRSLLRRDTPAVGAVSGRRRKPVELSGL